MTEANPFLENLVSNFLFDLHFYNCFPQYKKKKINKKNSLLTITELQQKQEGFPSSASLFFSLNEIPRHTFLFLVSTYSGEAHSLTLSHQKKQLIHICTVKLKKGSDSVLLSFPPPICRVFTLLGLAYFDV